MNEPLSIQDATRRPLMVGFVALFLLVFGVGGWAATTQLSGAVIAPGKTGRTRTGRLRVYVRDDRPFAGVDPPAAVYFYSPDRTREYPEAHLASYTRLMQADAYAGFNRLYEVTRIDVLFAIEREINGLPPVERWEVRQQRSRPRVEALGAWLREQYARLSSAGKVAQAIAYSLNCWDSLVRFLDDGRLCLSNNAAERAVRGIAVGRRNWTFAGSDAGGRRAAAIYTLIETAKLNDVDPQAWLADVLARLQDHPARQIAELPPWAWKKQLPQRKAAA